MASGVTTRDQEGVKEYKGASDQAISTHYDVGTPFYSVFLDAERVYSCALWEPGDSIEHAQRRKIDWLIDGAEAAGKSRVLDVGCGWGGALRRMRARGVGQVVGLTMSRDQASWLQEREVAGVEVRLENWADHKPDDLYDAIVSAGAFEHFASLGLTRDEKIAAYREYFRSCRRWLRPGSRMTLQTCVKGNARQTRDSVQDGRFLYDVIFPESDVPWLSEILAGSEKLFHVEAIRLDGSHYVRTLADWRARLRDRWDEALAVASAETVETYDRFFDAAIRQFADGYLDLARLVMQRT
jgi:cyclopropane-fatty-acyl-phospholipid synthase